MDAQQITSNDLAGRLVKAFMDGPWKKVYLYYDPKHTQFCFEFPSTSNKELQYVVVLDRERNQTVPDLTSLVAGCMKKVGITHTWFYQTWYAIIYPQVDQVQFYL
jgi:hypothetical protein